ncbi:hypothetical protein [Phaeobacter porticola]|nr:hypothetical protein [Phaeobacter porticola]
MDALIAAAVAFVVFAAFDSFGIDFQKLSERGDTDTGNGGD